MIGFAGRWRTTLLYAIVAITITLLVVFASPAPASLAPVAPTPAGSSRPIVPQAADR